MRARFISAEFLRYVTYENHQNPTNLTSGSETKIVLTFEKVQKEKTRKKDKKMGKKIPLKYNIAWVKITKNEEIKIWMKFISVESWQLLITKIIVDEEHCDERNRVLNGCRRWYGIASFMFFVLFVCVDFSPGSSQVAHPEIIEIQNVYKRISLAAPNYFRVNENRWLFLVGFLFRFKLFICFVQTSINGRWFVVAVVVFVAFTSILC